MGNGYGYGKGGRSRRRRSSGGVVNGGRRKWELGKKMRMQAWEGPRDSGSGVREDGGVSERAAAAGDSESGE